MRLAVSAGLPAALEACYRREIEGGGHGFDAASASAGLARASHEGARRSDDVGVYARSALAWLQSQFGCSDARLQRAVLASAALDLSDRSRDLPPSIRALQAVGHQRLVRSLTERADLSLGEFSRDVAFVTGLAVPAGAMSLYAPPPGLTALPLRVRRLAGQCVRRMSQENLASGAAWLGRIGLGQWIDLHVDDRYLEDFHARGLMATYRAAAALVCARPDLAGVRCASWFFDPELDLLSPHLRYLRSICALGGARFLRLPTHPDQIAFALQTSRTRRLAYEAGRYQPACFGMYWAKSDLIGWAAGSSDDRDELRRAA